MKLEGFCHHIAYGLNLYHKPLLRTIVLKISYNCNFQCVHCFSRIFGKEYNTNIKPAIMRYEDGCRILSEARVIGCKSVAFSGIGELTLHKDFYRLLFAAKRNGYRVKFPTNGWNIDPSHLEMLDKSDLVIFSIDKMHHDGSPDPGGYLARMEEVVRECTEMRFQTIIMIHGESTPDIDALADHLKIPCYRYPMVTKKSMNKPPIPVANQLVRCIKPWITMSVQPDMSVEPCCSSHGFPIDTLRDGHQIDDVWNGNAFMEFRNAVYSQNPPGICTFCDRWNRSLITWCRRLLLQQELL